MNKRGLKLVFTFLLAVFLISLVSAEIDNSTTIGASQQCIMNEVGEDCSQLTPEEQAAAIMALGDYKNCSESFISNTTSRLVTEGQRCWPRASCKLKDTSIALFALFQLNENELAEEAQNWLLNQTMIASELEWYMQITPITPEGVTTCTIKYGSTTASVEVLEDDSLSGTLGGCLSISTEALRLPGNSIKISSESSCIQQQYTISCDQKFITNLVYFAPGSPALHISPKSSASSADGETIEEVTYKCFEQADKCNYEGSLWAAMVLKWKNSGSSAPFVPYLVAGAEENEDLFPAAFLYKIRLNEFYQPIISEFNGDYWGTGANRFYETALALFALSEADTEYNDAKAYLSEEGIQGSNGCWGNTVDTAFLLYMGWPDEIFVGEINGNGGGGLPDCLASQNYCEYSQDCLDEGGSILDNYDCVGSYVCCSVEVLEKTCTELQGELCPTGYECPAGNTLSSVAEETCCAVECVESGTDNECVSFGGECKDSCDSDQESIGYDCDTYDVDCCVAKQPGFECELDSQCLDDEKCIDNKCVEKKSRWWIWVLIILIILVVLAIIFRKRIQFMMFKRKAGVKKGPGPKPTQPPTFPSRPTVPPRNLPSRPGPRQPRPVFQQPVRKPAPKTSSKDKEFEETLKRLKEMSR